MNHSKSKIIVVAITRILAILLLAVLGLSAPIVGAENGIGSIVWYIPISVIVAFIVWYVFEKRKDETKKVLLKIIPSFSVFFLVIAFVLLFIGSCVGGCTKGGGNSTQQRIEMGIPLY